MDLQDASALAISLLETHGLYSKGYRFEFDNAKRRFGACDYNRKVMSLSRPLTELRTPDNVRNTVLHEIAHAIVGPGMGHGRVWKLMAVAIGAKPERCGSSAGEGIEAPRGAWIGSCPNGHTIGFKFRKPKTGRISSCSICAPYFDPKYAITWTRNEPSKPYALAAQEVR